MSCYSPQMIATTTIETDFTKTACSYLQQTGHVYITVYSTTYIYMKDSSHVGVCVCVCVSGDRSLVVEASAVCRCAGADAAVLCRRRS